MKIKYYYFLLTLILICHVCNCDSVPSSSKRKTLSSGTDKTRIAKVDLENTLNKGGFTQDIASKRDERGVNSQPHTDETKKIKSQLLTGMFVYGADAATLFLCNQPEKGLEVRMENGYRTMEKKYISIEHRTLFQKVYVEFYGNIDRNTEHDTKVIVDSLVLMDKNQSCQPGVR